MDKPDFSSRGKPADQGRPDFSNRGRPAGQKPNYVPPQRKMDTSANLQTLFTQGATFGQSPRIFGALGAVMGVPDAIRQKSLDPLAEAYRQNRQAQIERIDQARASTGLLGMGMEMAGGLGTGGALANAGRQTVVRAAPNTVARISQAVAPRAGSTAGKIGRATARSAIAAGGGAAAGAVYGSGEGRAVENAIYGAVGGAAAEPVARTAGAAVRGLRRVVGKPKTKPEVTAARQMAGKIRPDAEQVIAESQRLGLDPPALIDLMTNAGKRRVRAVSSADDAAQELALKYQEITHANKGPRAQRIAHMITGRPVNLSATRQEADIALENVDKLNYNALNPIKVTVDTPLMQDLGTNQAASALNRSSRVSNTMRRPDDMSNTELMAEAIRLQKNYSVLGKQVSLQALEDVYRVMRDRAIGMMGAQGPQAVQRREGFALMQEAERLGQSLASRFPKIADARLASQQARQNIEAIDLGYNALDPNKVVSEVASEIGPLPVRGNVLRGAQARLQHEIGQNPLSTLKDMAFQQNTGEKLSAMGAPAQDITQAAQYEISRLRNADFISPNTGSQTTPRLQDAAELPGAIPVTPQGIFTKMLDFAYRRASSFTPDEMVAMVRMGVGPADLQQLQALAARDPDKVPAAVQALIGTQLGIQSANQANAAGRYPAGQ